MKLFLCPSRLLPLYLFLLPFLETTSATLDDVPGCACRAQDVCDGGPSGFAFDVAACVFAMRRNGTSMSSEEYSPYICDGLEANPEFRQTYGNEAEPEQTGFLPAKIALGTCEDFYAQQNSCPPPVVLEWNEDEGYVNTNSTDGYYHTNAWTSISGGCSGWSYLDFPTTNSTFWVFAMCKSNREITSGHDDSLEIYAGFREDAGCDDLPSMGLEQGPVLTSEDWIEPLPGRRYMGYDFVDDSPDGTNYCLMFVSLGNEQCRGPPPTDNLWIDPPMSSSVAHHRGLAWQLAFGFATAAFGSATTTFSQVSY